MNKYVFGMVSGMMVGAAVGMMVLPQLDRKTQKNFKRYGERIMDMVDDSCCSIMK